MAGDAADDIFDSMFETDIDIQIALDAMRKRCREPQCRQVAIWIDDGLLECIECRQSVDL